MAKPDQPIHYRLVLGLTGALIRAPKADAELFRIALSTRNFGYLPLYVGMRNGTIHARAFSPDAAVLLKKQGFTELGRSRRHGAVALGGILDRTPTWRIAATSSNAGPA